MKPELVSPVGTEKSLSYALAYGADAVYAGQPRYSLRVRNNEFNRPGVLERAISETHRQGRRFYLATNLAPHNDKVRSFLKDLAPIVEMGPDALIMSDPGLILMVRENWPELPVHLSVQSNVVNYAAVRFWQQIGIRRIILSRELSLDEIAEIRERSPGMELEVFVHGALCIAYSGRCLLSGYMQHRDSNQGACTNSCRWQYRMHPGTESDSGEIVPEREERVYLLEEEQRPGAYMPALEDEHGTYIMNSKDLRAVQHVSRLADMGIEAMKIEGRTKSHYYVARTAQVYRQAIEDAMAQRALDLALMDKLEGLANRGYTEGFYRRHVLDELQNYEDGSSVSERQRFVGEIVEEASDERVLTVEVRNRFAVGDRLEVMTPHGSIDFVLEEMMSVGSAAMITAPGDGHVVRIPNPGIGDTAHALLVRYLEA